MRTLATQSLLISLLCSSLAFAAPSPADLNAAREAYREGIGLETTGNWAGALAKFREVAAVKSTSRVRFHIGLCQEKLGRWTDALGAYNLALADAQQENAADAIKEAEAAKTALEGKIPRLTIHRAPGAEGASVSVDGTALGATSLGTEMPLDPGVHTIESAMPGRSPWRSTIELKEGERKTVEALPPGAPAPAQPPASQPSAAVSSSTPVLPWILIGTGAASFAASGVFYVLRQGAVSDLKDACGPQYHCTEAQRPRYDDARSYNLLTNVTLGVGALGVGAGAVLLLAGTGRKSAEKASSDETKVSVTVHPTGVGLAGRF